MSEVEKHETAAFIGHRRGTTKDNWVTLINIYNTHLYYKKDFTFYTEGELEGVDNPTLLPDYGGKTLYTFRPGDIVKLPVWDDELYEKALQTLEFASPEAVAEILAGHEEAFALSEAEGGNLDVYAARMKQTHLSLCQKGLIYKPQSLLSTKREGNCCLED